MEGTIHEIKSAYDTAVIVHSSEGLWFQQLEAARDEHSKQVVARVTGGLP